MYLCSDSSGRLCSLPPLRVPTATKRKVYIACLHQISFHFVGYVLSVDNMNALFMESEYLQYLFPCSQVPQQNTQCVRITGRDLDDAAMHLVGGK